MQINLLPHQSQAPFYFKVCLMALTFLLLLANVLFVFAWVQARQDRSLSEARLQQANRLLPDLNNKSQKISQNDATQRQVDAFNQWAGKRPSFTEDIRLLRSYMPGSARFEKLSYNGEGQYELQALFLDMRSISTYLYQLKNDKKIASLRVKSVKREEGTSPSLDGRSLPSTQDTNGGQPLSFSDQVMKNRAPQSIDPKNFADPSPSNGRRPGNLTGNGSSNEYTVGSSTRASVGGSAGGGAVSSAVAVYHVDLEIVFSR
jgi:hypothetical protein